MTDREQDEQVAIAHDYLTQRGGAERVVLDFVAAFPTAPLYTALYDPLATFSDFTAQKIVRLPIDRISPLRSHHRAAFPLLAPSFSRLHLDYPVLLCSSSGWAHATKTDNRKIVYCHTPARWLYQSGRYLGDRHRWARGPLEVVAVPLRRWDRLAARSAHRYLVNSSVVRGRVAATYGIDAEVLSPAPGIEADGPTDAIPGLDHGFMLCVARLIEYKNVESVVAAFVRRPDLRLVVAGTGPLLGAFRHSAPKNVMFTGSVSEPQLRWLYRACVGVIAASHEDFGLTPIEGYVFEKPTVALRWGGYLDTVREGETGTFFEVPEPDLISRAVTEFLTADFRSEDLRAQAERFSRRRFVERMREVVREELAN